MSPASEDVKLVVASNGDELKANIAKHVAISAKQAIDARGQYNMALSGGSMPQTLSGLAEVEGVDWSKVYVFFSDERCVPLDDDDSNYKACASALLNKLPIPASQIITIDPALSPEEAAKTYEQKIIEGFGLKSGEVAQFDSILLGMGPDGHTASLFPGHSLLQEKEKMVAAINDSPKPPPQRITLTFPVLNNAREVIFIAAGSSKANLFAEAFSVSISEGGTKVSIRPGLPYPAFQVQPTKGGLYWYTDIAGAALLPENVIKGK